MATAGEASPQTDEACGGGDNAPALILRSATLAARLEGWPLARPCLLPSFETAAQARPPQDEVRWVSSANLTHLHRVSFVKHG
jgi:hypothetical protein